jgi:predicted SAM-dependent methyltransferase
LSKFEKNSAEEIYACHVLEHFNRFEYKEVLGRWFEILKPNGVLKLSVPDIGAVVNQYNNGVPLKKLMGFLNTEKKQ